ncbi:MAG: FtsX-like permease family protein, partial [Rhodospirillales bacterium]|nr:FtsX-like permease family protein [Rhodospirillales bacterium]
FALLPLARARAVPAAALYRDRIAPQGLGRILNKRWRKQIAMLAAVGLGVGLLAALTILTASDKYFAVWFVGGAIATLLALRGGARLMQAAARRARPRNAAWRLVLANIHRPGTQAPGVVLALGLGLSVLVAVALIEGNLARQINERLPDEAPAFFFIDIQPDQVAGFDKAVTAVPGTRDLQRVPTLRGRIVRINGVAVEDVKISHDVSWAVRGDRALTYAAKPAETARITAGNWWPENYAGPPVISLDAGLARGFGIGIGDTLTLNVLGRDIRATIMSLREIDWRSLRFDFAIIFAPGTLEGAPHTHIAALKAERSSEAAVEAALAGPLANISAIRVREALEQAAGMLSGIGLGIRGTALITIFSGALVLAGAIAAGHRRRVYDAVVFKVLGARRRTIFKTFLMEYGVVGLATGVIASAIGTLTAWAVVVFLMRSDWVFLPGVAAITVLICIVLTVFAGFAGTWRALGRKPGPYLRNE